MSATRDLINKLRRAGLSEAQATAIIDAQHRVIDEKIVTKSDLREFLEDLSFRVATMLVVACLLAIFIFGPPDRLRASLRQTAESALTIETGLILAFGIVVVGAAAMLAFALWLRARDAQDRKRRPPGRKRR